ncbi:MAG: hypothetical protein IPI49_32565 [Myxococcales bacterium]|nr:hypothetical protein [Myxococcales bacterium]
MANPIVFYACEAWLSAVLAERVCEVWLQNPKAINYDKGKTIRIDLGATPSRSLTGVEVDDFVVRINDTDELGLTTLGGRWPMSHRGTGAHAAAGAVWLEESVWKNAQRHMGHYPPLAGTHEDRWKSLLYHDGTDRKTWRRYVGYQVELVSRTGSQATVQVRGALDSDQLPGKEVTFDLTDPLAVDTSQPIQLAKPNDHAVVFFRLEWMRSHPKVFFIPKLPIGEGTGAEFSRRAGRDLLVSPAVLGADLDDPIDSLEPWHRSLYLRTGGAESAPASTTTSKDLK